MLLSCACESRDCVRELLSWKLTHTRHAFVCEVTRHIPHRSRSSLWPGWCDPRPATRRRVCQRVTPYEYSYGAAHNFLLPRAPWRACRKMPTPRRPGPRRRRRATMSSRTCLPGPPGLGRRHAHAAGQRQVPDTRGKPFLGNVPRHPRSNPVCLTNASSVSCALHHT